jgi:hypothetical protein
MRIHLIQHLVQMLNLTIQPNGVSDIYSPATIILGTQLDADIHCRLEFGTYCQVHDDTDPRNSVHAPLMPSPFVPLGIFKAVTISFA